MQYAIKLFLIIPLLINACGGNISVKDTSTTERLNKSEIDIYAAGNIMFVGGGYWKNGVWNYFNVPQFKLSSFAVHDKDIYAGGQRHDKREFFVACYIKNGKLIDLAPNCWGGNSNVNSIGLLGNDIYAGGYSEDCKSVRTVGYWKNGKYVKLKTISLHKNSSVSSVFVYGSETFASGTCINSSNTAVAGYWKNETWISLEPADSKLYTSATNIFVISNDVYIAGARRNKLQDMTIGYWKNGLWSEIESDAERTYITSLFIYEDDVYACGVRYKGSNVNSDAGYWKNGKWIELERLDPNRSSYANSIVVNNGDVYIGGWSRNSLNKDIAGYWKNGKWVSLSDGKENAEVKSIVVVPRVEAGK